MPPRDHDVGRGATVSFLWADRLDISYDGVVAMTLSFTDHIDTMERDEQGLGVVFVGRRARYEIPPLPEDIAETLRHAHRAGHAVQVTYDTETRVIADVTVPRC